MRSMKMLLAISKNKQNQKGFSLVELMVVVAIIGILAAVAVPSVNKYMAKARQTEAKTNLSSYYGAQKIFFTDYGIFDSKFTVIGFKPEGNLRYNIGIPVLGMLGGFGVGQLGTYGYTSPVADTARLARGAVGIGYCQDQAGVGGYALAGCRWTADSGATVIVGGCAPVLVALTNFTACAAGKITNRVVWDSWSIDENKRLLNVTDGTE